MHVFALYAAKIIEVTHAEHTKLTNFMNGGSPTFWVEPVHLRMHKGHQIVQIGHIKIKTYWILNYL